MSTTWPIVFMGTPQIAAATLAELVQGPDSVVGVVTQPDRPSGRGQQRAPSPVRKFAESRGIPVVAPENQDSSAELIARVRAADVDGLGVPADPGQPEGDQ